MFFYFKTRKGNYHTARLNIFILPLIVLILAAIVVIWASIREARYQSTFEKTYQAILSRQASITVSDRSDDLNAVLRCAFSTPELFTVDLIHSQEFSNGVRYSFQYNSYTEHYEENLKEYNAYIDAIVAEAPEFSDDRAAVKWIHDYIIQHYEYGGEHSAFSMLRNGRGVCSAYTGLFTALADRLGVEHSVARSEKMDHTWNLVKLNGYWYHIDVTWDDKGEEASYEYYLKTSEEFLTLKHYDWVDSGVSLTTYENIKFMLLRIGAILFAGSLIVTFIPWIRAYFFE